jgi:hypothetical protein
MLMAEKRARGGIGLDCLKDIATHGTLSPYWDPMNLIWIAQELVIKRQKLDEAKLLLERAQASHAVNPLPQEIRDWLIEDMLS